MDNTTRLGMWTAPQIKDPSASGEIIWRQKGSRESSMTSRGILFLYFCVRAFAGECFN